MLLMEKMLPHLGFIQPFPVLSHLTSRPLPIAALGQQMTSLASLIPQFTGTHPLKISLPNPESQQRTLQPFSVLGRDPSTAFIESGADHGGSISRVLNSPYDRDDDKGKQMS